jgi:hypothetical protein
MFLQMGLDSQMLDLPVRQMRKLIGGTELSLAVMAGHSGLRCADYVHLSALPAIHVLFRARGTKDVDHRVIGAK